MLAVRHPRSQIREPSDILSSPSQTLVLSLSVPEAGKRYGRGCFQGGEPGESPLSPRGAFSELAKGAPSRLDTTTAHRALEGWLSPPLLLWMDTSVQGSADVMGWVPGAPERSPAPQAGGQLEGRQSAGPLNILRGCRQAPAPVWAGS